MTPSEVLFAAMRWTVACVLLVTVVDGAVYRKFVPNTNFDNSKNWDGDEVPCGKDTAYLPDGPIAVFIGSSVNMKQLVLPENGQVILGDSVTVSFTDNPPSGDVCQGGRDVRFRSDKPPQWYDPRNWCSVTSPEVDCPTPPELLDLLHTEMVPCGMDDVVFPSQSSFLVNITNVNAHLHSIRFNDELYYTTSSFASFLETPMGETMFPVDEVDGTPDPVIDITTPTCQDDSGCACGNDIGKPRSLICATVHCDEVPATCTSPFTPVGHCCPVCGGMLVISIGVNFKLAHFRDYIQHEYITPTRRRRQTTPAKLGQITSKRSDAKVQLVILDNGDGSAASAIARQIYTDLDQNAFGIVKMVLTTTGEGSVTAAPSKGHDLSSGGGLAAIIAGVLVVVVLVIALLTYLYCKKKHPTLPLSLVAMFSRKKLDDDEASFELGNRESVQSRGTTQGFDNPVYDTPVNAKGIEVVDFDPKTSSFDNPNFETPVQETFYQDPSKGDPTVDLGGAGK